MVQMYKNNSNLRQNKRRIATIKGAKFDLKKELPLMFMAFKEAYELYESEIIKTPPEARARGYEASLLNSKMIQCIQKYFPKHWKFGKYKRFTLRANGYIILFKKLDKYNKPMNIKTKSVEAISNQLSLPLFNDTNFVEEPILFFGYKKNSIGVISEPKLVYLDEERVKWVVTINDVEIDKAIDLPVKTKKVATPVIREEKQGDKKVG
tara:strand:- start:1167 stop:1790 length:624 start_codon:yes stop_codon:yes gene_type:complete